jgi:DNA repair protein RecO (recombination protein O)
VKRKKNRPLFAFLEHSIEVLENTDSGIANFHIAFLLQLTRYLGILPNLERYRLDCYFDLMNAEYVDMKPFIDIFFA